MSTIQTYSGLLVDPLLLREEDIALPDIIQALGNIARFTGHTRRHYSVLEHSLRVAALVNEAPGSTAHDVAWALLHDASEAYLPKLPLPLRQRAELNFYTQAQAGCLSCIARRFGLQGAEPPWKITAASLGMRYWESVALLDEPYIWKNWESFGRLFPKGKFEAEQSYEKGSMRDLFDSWLNACLEQMKREQAHAIA